MIVEGAFYKLPELITRYEYTTLSGAPSIHEHTLHGSFAMCLLTELNSRNLQNPMQYIYLEEPYPKNKKLRSDVCIKIPPRLVQEIEPRLKFLGFRRTNYIEVKLFFEKKEVANQSKTGNVGKIINDLLRLKKFATDDVGRYLLIVFNRKKEDYLAFRAKYGERHYLNDLLTVGKQEISIDLSREPKSLIEEVKIDVKKSDFPIKIYTLAIETEKGREEKSEKYYFYLIKIK